MSISWGGYNGHLRVGIDHSISPSNPSHSDTTVKVTWKYYVGTDGWNFSGDSSTLHEDCDGWGGTNDNFTNNLSSGHMLVGTHTETYSIDYNSGSKGASASLSGAYNGASPSHSVSVNLPNRPIATPSAGEGVTLVSTSTTSAVVSWNSPNDNGGDTVDNYQLQVADNSGFSNPAYDQNTGNNTTGNHTVTGLSPNTHYYARVRAHNSAGWGNWTSSTYCQFTTDGGVPATPSSLGRIGRTQTSITVSWNTVSSNGGGAVTYDAECYSDAGLTTLVASSYGQTDTSWQATGLTAATTYYFRVRASNANFGAGGWSGTDPEVTKSVTTYDDSGDYVTLVNNLASAVADKMLHLGTFCFRGKTSDTTIAASGNTYVVPGTELEVCNLPDPPTYLGNSGYNPGSIQINYPGTYKIEWSQRLTATAGAIMEMVLYVNDQVSPSSTSGGRAGEATVISNADGNFHARPNQLSCVRRLEAGDTLAFAIQNNSSTAETNSAASGSDLTMWVRVTMIGF